MSHTKFVICINNSGYPASLEKRKIYEVVPGNDQSDTGFVRVIDESGSDYLYPEECFVDAPLPEAIEAAIVRAA